MWTSMIQMFNDKYETYIEGNEVLVVVMGPTCRTLGPCSHLNKALNYGTWLNHYNEDMPHARFCGGIALLQVKKGRHFICGNPFPTGLWYEPPWPQVAQQPGVQSVVIDQCRVAQKAPDGKPIKKPTTLIASASELLEPFSEPSVPWSAHPRDNVGTWPGAIQSPTVDLAIHRTNCGRRCKVA